MVAYSYMLTDVKLYLRLILNNTYCRVYGAHIQSQWCVCIIL